MRVTRFEETEELLSAVFVESFVALGEQPAGPIQRVVSPSPMPERLVLHATPALARWVEVKTRLFG